MKPLALLCLALLAVGHAFALPSSLAVDGPPARTASPQAAESSIPAAAEKDGASAPIVSPAAAVEPSPSPGILPTTIKAVPVFLRRADGHWSASLSDNLKDPATENIEVSLKDGSVRVLTWPHPGGGKSCVTKATDRAEYGYLDCNSAFYSVNAGSAAAGTLLRGVLSLGILTVSDMASGMTVFTVSLDKAAVKAAVAESKAIDFARESAPLVEYRGAFAMANSSRQLRNFVARYEGVFDPESLVAKAQEKLPLAIQQEEARNRQLRAVEARQAEADREQELRRQAEMEAVMAFQRGLRPGDRVKMMRDRYTAFYGMLIEVKPPLAYLQWENVTPAMQWVRLDNLLPPR